MWIWEEFQVCLEGNGNSKKCCVCRLRSMTERNIPEIWHTSKAVEPGQLSTTIIQRQKECFGIKTTMQWKHPNTGTIGIWYHLSLCFFVCLLFFFILNVTVWKWYEVITSFDIDKTNGNVPFDFEMSRFQFYARAPTQAPFYSFELEIP